MVSMPVPCGSILHAYEQELAGETTCPADQGGPERKFLASTGTPGSGNGPGQHPLSAASFCFSCLRSAVDRRSGCKRSQQELTGGHGW
ncbi:hypothetical protein MTO96_025021 [Rhipicephalus appendiculatus]